MSRIITLKRGSTKLSFTVKDKTAESLLLNALEHTNALQDRYLTDVGSCYEIRDDEFSIELSNRPVYTSAEIDKLTED